MASSSWLGDLLGAVFVFQHALAPSSFVMSACPCCIHVYCLWSTLNTLDACSLFSLLHLELILPRSGFHRRAVPCRTPTC